MSEASLLEDGVRMYNDGRFDEAMKTLDEVLKINPESTGALYNIACCYASTNRNEEALEIAEHLMNVLRDNPIINCFVGGVLSCMGEYEPAIEYLETAVKLAPHFETARMNYISTLVKMGNASRAIGQARRAMRRFPACPDLHLNMACAFTQLGNQKEAIEAGRRVLKLDPRNSIAHSNLIFSMDMLSDRSTEELQGERKLWNRSHAMSLYSGCEYANDFTPGRKLRIGYVSADLKNHSASKVFGGMLVQFDTEQFEVYVYSNLNGPADKFTDLFREKATVWRDAVGMSDDTLAQTIRDDRIDILVDLSGHSAGHRLLAFARKPAPIQVTAWGYATSTGMDAMDYFFADPVTVPREDRKWFVEEVVDLPCICGFFIRGDKPDVNELPALTNGYVTFGSLNRLAKITKESYATWAKILKLVPNSRLYLKAGELTNDETRKMVLKNLTDLGIAEDRIIIEGGSPWYEHVQAFNKIDLALDPFPHGGGVTTLECLMMGIPVVTLRWPTIVGRLSAAILTAVGLKSWVAENREEYVSLVLDKVSDLASLAELRRTLRPFFMSSIVGDEVAYCRAVESRYKELWARKCAEVAIEERKAA